MAKRKLLSLIKPEIIELIIWNGEKWMKEDGTEAIVDPIREFIIEDEINPSLIHYICKYGYRISEEDEKIKVLRIGFKEYEQESISYMA